MFTCLQLQNFKAWQDTGELSLKPVTMLLGTNSSGKSSLIQSLLLMKQTVQSPDRSIHLNLGGDEINDLFNFGDFEDVMYRHAAEREFSLRFSFTALSGKIAGGDFECRYRKNSAGGVAVQAWQVQGAGMRLRSLRREKGAYSLLVGDENAPRGKNRNFYPERSVALSAEAWQALGAEADGLQDLSLALRRALERVVYLGPLRRKPERDYVWNKGKPGEVGSDGHRAIDVLLASALMKGEEQHAVIDNVSRWLQRMGVADKLEVKQLGRSTRYEVVVHRGDVESNLRDVGIGISQVLPVLTLAYFAAPGSTILLEEPEIHLHPLAQAVLAELFVEVSRTRQVQFIVETHSEHLFRRMQTLLARETTHTEQVAMYFVERGTQGAALRELKLDSFGRVNNWPEHFFGDALGETREQARLVFERQKAQRP